MQDGEARVLEDSALDPKTFHRMLQFMYYGEYAIEVSDTFDLKTSAPGKDPVEEKDAATKDPWAVAEILIAHIYAFVAGDAYKIAELKTLAAEKFRKEGVMLDPMPTDIFVAIAEIVYRETSSPSQLRNSLMKMAIRHRRTLLADKESVRAIQKGQDLVEFEASYLQSLNKLVDAYYKTSQKNSEKLEIVKEQMCTSKKETEMSAKELESVKTQLDFANRKVEQLKVLSRWSACRQCGVTWTYRLEQSGHGHLARCVYCGTTHFANL